MTRGGDTQSNLEELIEKRCAQRLSMLSFFDMETNTTKKDPLKFGAADYLLTKIIAVGFVLVSAIVTIVSPIGKPLASALAVTIMSGTIPAATDANGAPAGSNQILAT